MVVARSNCSRILLSCNDRASVAHRCCVLRLMQDTHPRPGVPFYGARRTAYLPNNDDGQEVCRLLQRAFDARLVFTVGRSITTGLDNTVVWNDIHHKTRPTGPSVCPYSV